MILERDEIDRQVRAGSIVIDPYSPADLNPASYSYHLGPEVFEAAAHADNGVDHAANLMTAEGVLLQPGRLYLSSTAEIIGSLKYVTLLAGRRSIAECGLFVQLSANLGNLGPAHRWTLELTCVQPVRIHAGMLIGQVTFWEPEGHIASTYSGPYTQHSRPIGNLRKF